MHPRRKQKISWSPKLAYAVGLITTDGSLSTDERHMVLVSKDIQLLKTFKKILGLKNKIGARTSSYTGRKDCYHVSFGDVVLYKWLLEKGLTPNKTHTIGELKIPDKYFPDFLRGHFDGDGSSNAYWDPRWRSSFMFYTKFYSVSEKHILWLRSRIENLLHIKGSLDKSIRPERRPLYQLKYAKTESRIIFSKMHYKENLPCLKRKYKKLKNHLETDNIENYRKIKQAEVEELVDSHP